MRSSQMLEMQSAVNSNFVLTAISSCGGPNWKRTWCESATLALRTCTPLTVTMLGVPLSSSSSAMLVLMGNFSEALSRMQLTNRFLPFSSWVIA
ncbi:hypothetical protein T06_9604 [Trichinella sp. T6]|nr:hypothetical protein T06_9604 [Trichinella sp. T6]